jgi:predicted CoA-substrate-specific enzyme activase
MSCIAGIDVGTGFTKAVLVDVEGERAARFPLGRGLVKTGAYVEDAAARALDQALRDAGRDRRDLVYIATTGFGRSAVGFRDIQITEITSGARGARWFFPDATLVLDIGNHSTRAIRLDARGKVSAFKMNEKCAAGSGSFLMRAAKYLHIGLEELGELSLRATHPRPISSVCAVLAETEIINHVSAGASIEDIVRGIHNSLAERAALLLRRVGIGADGGQSSPLVFIGGVARQRGMIVALQERLGLPVRVPPDCDYVCALGAALLGLYRWQKRHASSSSSPCASLRDQPESLRFLDR